MTTHEARNDHLARCVNNLCPLFLAHLGGWADFFDDVILDVNTAVTEDMIL